MKLECIKLLLRSYEKEDVLFNEPHFTNQLAAREGSREDVLKNILNPERLAYASVRTGKHGDDVYSLYFKISNTRTMKLPVIFNPSGKKGLYILTYIMRHRAWQSMVRER